MTAAGIHHREGPPVLHGFPCRVSILHTHAHTHTHTHAHTHTPSPCLSLLLPQLAQKHRMELCPRCVHRVDLAAPGIPLSCVKGGGAEGAKVQASCATLISLSQGRMLYFALIYLAPCLQSFTKCINPSTFLHHLVEDRGVKETNEWFNFFEVGRVGRTRKVCVQRF